jgi:hypothetical protein
MDIVAEARAEIVKLWGEGVTLAEDVGEDILATLRSTWLAIQPAQWAILQGLIVEAIQDIQSGDLADIETAVLNKAEAAAHDFVTEMESAVLQALIAMVRAAKII